MSRQQGLDYPGVGPEHAWLHEIGRAEYVGATDDEALKVASDMIRDMRYQLDLDTPEPNHAFEPQYPKT